tara:strand:+ start:2309 stop:4096 length:1788 start_codon:yes stop_codon:yes gene_type:complete
MAYKEEEFVKILNGVEAPSGFHYMPNGKLMNDAHHIAQYGYIDKKINSIDIDFTDISHLGESRSFTISGGGYVSIEIYDDAATPNYYNFYTNTWSTDKNGSIHKIKIEGTYTNYINFEENTSSLKKFTFRVIAETVYNCRTSQGVYVESRNADNSININKSTGSNSNIVEKIIYQDVEKSLFISCIAPSKYATATDTVDGTTSSSNLIVFTNNLSSRKVFVGDLITTGSEATTAEFTLITSIDPDGDNPKKIQTSLANSITGGATVTFTPAFNGVTPHSSDSTTGRETLSISSGGSLSSSFTVTITAPSGRLLTVTKTPTTDDLCFFKNVTIGSAAIDLPGEDTSSGNFRWPVDNITGITEGMSLDPARSGGGANTTTPSVIKPYIKTVSIKSFDQSSDYGSLYDETIEEENIKGVSAGTNDITAVDRNGRPTAQAGNLIFSKQQASALADDTSVRIFAQGADQIKSMTGMDISLSDVEVTLTDLLVTTSGSVSNSTTIPLASTDGGMGNIAVGAEISGTNIDASVANPTVVSKAGQTGAGNIVVSSNQTLESGQTLTVENFATTITVTGKINVSNFPLSDTTIFLNLERFLISV